MTQINHHIEPVWIFGGVDARVCDSRNSLKKKKSFEVLFTYTIHPFIYLLFGHTAWHVEA